VGHAAPTAPCESASCRNPRTSILLNKTEPKSTANGTKTNAKRKSQSTQHANAHARDAHARYINAARENQRRGNQSQGKEENGSTIQNEKLRASANISAKGAQKTNATANR